MDRLFNLNQFLLSAVDSDLVTPVGTDSLLDRLSFVLLHFLWQGFLVAFLLKLSLKLSRKSKTTTRYMLCSMAMMAMILLPVTTFFLLPKSDLSGHITPVTSHISEINVIQAETTVVPEMELVGIEHNSMTYSPFNHLKKSFQYFITPLNRWETIRLFYYYYYKYMHSLIPLVWMFGVTLFFTRFMLSLRCALNLTASVNSGHTPFEWIESASRISKKIGLKQVPDVRLHSTLKTAMAVGFVKPVILIPASWMMKIPPQYIEAIIAHELSHIKRWDLWFIILQRWIEIFFFFHPAVWWLSGKLHMYREMCCDEMAANLTFGDIEYAEALKCVAGLNKSKGFLTPIHAVTFSEKKFTLSNRLSYLLEKSEPENTGPGKLLFILILVIFFNFGIRSIASVQPEFTDELEVPGITSSLDKSNLRSGDDYTEFSFSSISFDKSGEPDSLSEESQLLHTENLETLSASTVELNSPELSETRILKSGGLNTPQSQEHKQLAKFKLLTVPLSFMKSQDWPIKNSSYIKVPVERLAFSLADDSSHAQSLLDISTHDELLPEVISRIIQSPETLLHNEGIMNLPDKPIDDSGFQKEGFTSWNLSYIDGRRYLFKFKIQYSNTKYDDSWEIETQLIKGTSSISETTRHQLRQNEGLLQVFPVPEQDKAILVYTQHPAHFDSPRLLN